MSRFNSSRAGNNRWPDNTELFTLLESNLSRIDEELQPLVPVGGPLWQGPESAARSQLLNDNLRMLNYNKLASLLKDSLSSSIRSSAEEKTAVWLVALQSAVDNIYQLAVRDLALAPEVKLGLTFLFSGWNPQKLEITYRRVHDAANDCFQALDKFKIRLVDQPAFWSAVTDFYQSVTTLHSIIKPTLHPDRHLEAIADYIDFRHGLIPVEAYDRKRWFEQLRGDKEATLASYQHFRNLLSQVPKVEWQYQVEQAVNSWY